MCVCVCVLVCVVCVCLCARASLSVYILGDLYLGPNIVTPIWPNSYSVRS